jgi:predicted amidophosphoribosyltransferase
MERDYFKVCPECAGEYRLEIERCADCGVPLVDPEWIAVRDARELPLSSRLMALRTAPVAWALALAADLDRERIRYRIDRRRALEDGLLTVCVLREDRQAARSVDKARERIEAPGEPEEGTEELGLLEESASYKVCPRCGGEYRLDIERCADCEVDLVFPAEAEETLLEAEPDLEPDLDLPLEVPFVSPLHTLTLDDDLVCVCCRYLGALQALSGALNDAGIAHCLDPLQSRKGAACLFVLPADGDAAAAIDAGLWNAPLLDDDPELRAELTVCPACGTPHALGVTECRGCGLVLGGGPGIVDQTCSRCGAVIGFKAPSCPNCGAALPGE